MAQIADDSPEARLLRLESTVRQLRAGPPGERYAYSDPAASLSTGSAWQDDPAVYTDVFIRNGGLSATAGAILAPAAGVTAYYGFRIYSTSVDGSGNVYVGGLAVEANPRGAVIAVGCTIGASRAARVTGLPAGNYRVVGAIWGSGAGSYSTRSLIVRPS